MVKALYDDILERIPTPPLWYDENAVPRYCEFSPIKVANIYAREAALILITTQNGPFFRFRVAVTDDSQVRDLALNIRNQTVAFGDPPRILDPEEDGSGYAESSETLGVLQYWKHNRIDWIRDQSLEFMFTNSRYENAPYKIR